MKSIPRLRVNGQGWAKIGVSPDGLRPSGMLLAVAATQLQSNPVFFWRVEPGRIHDPDFSTVFFVQAAALWHLGALRKG